MRTLTWIVELGVGIACLAVGAMSSRNPRLRVVSVVLLAAGIAAAAHASVQLARG